MSGELQFVGRLDKLTSGVVLVSKRKDIFAALQRAMAARRIDKDYLAIVHGKPSPVRGTICSRNLTLCDCSRVRTPSMSVAAKAT